jgi:hypothetical protein
LALFCVFSDVSFPIVSVYTILAFIEFLADSKLAAPTILNYISSAKSKLKLAWTSIASFESPQVSLALLSLSKNAPRAPTIKPVFSPQQFLSLLLYSSKLPLH